jgi:hypothetical protein
MNAPNLLRQSTAGFIRAALLALGLFLFGIRIP